MKEVDLLLGFQTRAPWQVLSMSLLLSNIEASELLQSAPSMYTDMMHFKTLWGMCRYQKYPRYCHLYLLQDTTIITILKQ